MRCHCMPEPVWRDRKLTLPGQAPEKRPQRELVHHLRIFVLPYQVKPSHVKHLIALLHTRLFSPQYQVFQRRIER